MAKAEDLPTPSALINPRPIIASVYEFFRRNRLSSILEQVNPLSEVDNLRRLSVMGTGGVTRERASFSMRDINASQYSRICPVRSPEGQNIGLVTYLALYTHINEFGFLESPYFKVEKEELGGKTVMKISKDIVYITADDEEKYYVTHAEVGRDGDIITDKWVAARFDGQFIEVDVTQIQLIDVVPRQVVGTSASLIPFVHHDNGTRALMGSHMQTQAVPLLKPEAPIVGTGMEASVAQAMGWVVRARHAGKVISSDANHISIKLSEADAKVAAKEISETDYGFVTVKGDVETYEIRKYHRTSQSTSYSQYPIVMPGDVVEKNDIIINGPAAEDGELAIGQNLFIAYGSLEGLGYEDAIAISSRLVEEDLLSSIHINEYVADVMDTKLGAEELTSDIPNVSESDLRNLGVDGIVVIGSNVSPNDILVGKIAPKGETELTAEERLLRAIFGEKAREVRDTSLRMPHGEQGTVISVQILDREQGDELDAGVIRQIRVKVAQLRRITVGDKLAGRHGNKGVISKIVPKADMPYMADGRPVDILISPLSVLARMNLGQLLEAQLALAAQTLGIKIGVPVFEKIDEEKISALLEKAGYDKTAKVQLYDGRTGEPFSQKTAVGVAYILKLIHMVEDKTHARSTGPYSLVTQQPLGGKAQMGGQRLGEMEVWAFEAHKAAHSLQEMLTIKSDDVIGRSKAFEAIVKGLPIPESTVPESFKVLVKELNSLCLSIVPTGPVIADEPEVAPVVAPADDSIPGGAPADTSSQTSSASGGDDTDDDGDDEDEEIEEEKAVTENKIES
jgi:DNA-directed RNA polymerase subunit beta